MPDRKQADAMRAVPTSARDGRNFLGNLTQAVQDNPISAALIGMGSALAVGRWEQDLVAR